MKARPSALKTQKSITEDSSLLHRYQAVIVGSRGLLTTIYFEWCSWLSPVPGAFGLLLRKIFWPRLFRTCGKGVMFGANIILRHPNRIRIGNNTVLSEGVLLDARHSTDDTALQIGDEVILANNTMLSCKDGTINIGDRVGIGAYTIIQSVQHCPVVIGNDAVLGPRCYLVGGGQYHTDSLNIPIAQQGIKPTEGCFVGPGAWLGANVSIIDGGALGEGSIAATGAVIVRDVPAYEIVAGVPAQKIKDRQSEQNPD